MPGLAAALWLLGLFAAAPVLRTSARYAFVDRLRDALVLGIAIPFALGLVHALYPVACWLALAACAGVAYYRAQTAAREERSNETARPPYLLVAVLAAIAWPPLMRPLLDGDSLSYHLPNAAAWVQAHSLWTQSTRYWWYPPASELFASALYAVAGPYALPWSGVGAIALLGFRIVAWARDEFGAPPALADALAAATVTVLPIAIQAGTLQNDVWLAAFWMESLWAIGRENGAAIRSIAVTALLKPQGWILAAIALATSRARLQLWLAAAGAIALWGLHDALAWGHAIVPPRSTSLGAAGSSIAAHGAPALALLVQVTLRASPFALVALLAALFGPLSKAHRRLGLAACAAAIVFIALPFGYATDVAQLATGASLRFAAPAIAAGALLLLPLAMRVPLTSTLLLGLCALYGAGLVIALFYNDLPALLALLVALLAVAVVAYVSRTRRAWPAAAGIAAVSVAAYLLAASHPVDFYADALRVRGRPTGVYAWLGRAQPPAIGGWGLSIGTVNVLAPRARTLELPDENACAIARQQNLLLVAVAEDGRPDAFNAARLTAARRCGRVRYDDGIAVVTAPLW